VQFVKFVASLPAVNPFPKFLPRLSRVLRVCVTAFYDTGFSRVTRPRGLGGSGQGTLDLLPFTNNVLRSSTGAEVQFLLAVIGAPFRLIFAYNPQRLVIEGQLLLNLR
jgi:hypothetical protein